MSRLHSHKMTLEYLERELECLEAACETLRQQITNERAVIDIIVKRAQSKIPCKEFDFDFYDDVSNAALVRGEYGKGVLVDECFRPYVNFGAA